MYNLGPASKSETIVFGAERPGYPSRNAIDDTTVCTWINHLRAQGIGRICCLLTEHHLECYTSDLIHLYQETLGAENICHVPIVDYHLSSPEQLHGTILPFLQQAERDQVPVVVHCSGGIGRTGHVLAAWLVYARHFTPIEAIDAVVQASTAYRDPLEAIHVGKASETDLFSLLASCQTA